jgi:hypothetical protein
MQQALAKRLGRVTAKLAGLLSEEDVAQALLPVVQCPASRWFRVHEAHPHAVERVRSRRGRHGALLRGHSTKRAQDVIELEHRGLIERVPRQPRSIKILISPDDIPAPLNRPIKSSVSRY